MMAINKAMVINKVDKTMDEILQQYENIREIKEALSSPTGVATDFDDIPFCFSQQKQNQRRGSWGFTGRDDSLIGFLLLFHNRVQKGKCLKMRNGCLWEIWQHRL
ncbi:hypothetical protein SLE2022_319460 [Rubroshorea leprosula]